ncbi:Nuclease-related domain, NERD [Moorella glycerini]|uniref:DNA 3'-5' helicase n=1 Tax=Neomoorella stamsii TaxID=1266720 RepID=A0A9X7J5P6_9FIRM|nr:MULTISPECIES: UvrD-helicase domain-containing protein [Moorella]PRR76755.1 RecBCD enzyme subunit RecB [Moorella stamsii]CEP66711.1 Nuclease-related domain, NERD [Moorella glycerini]
MATLVSNADLNYGESAFWDALNNALPDDFIVYAKREVNGREFDFCILMPNHGIVVVEVKGWTEDSIVRIEDGDQVIVFYEGQEYRQNPKRQARAYRFDLLNTIRKMANISPLIFDMVCYPFLGRDFFLSSGLNAISGEAMTFLKEDLADAGAFKKKLLQAYNIASRWGNPSPFDATTMYRVREIFEPGISKRKIKENETLTPGSSFAGASTANKHFVNAYYSVLQFVAEDVNDIAPLMGELLSWYVKGTKIYLIVSTSSQYATAKGAFYKLLSDYGLQIKQGNLFPALTKNDLNSREVLADEGSFSCFNFLLTIAKEKAASRGLGSFRLIDGTGYKGTLQEEALKHFHKTTGFNFHQYALEHADPNKNIVVRAGAGTGKTFSMITRITYLCYVHNYSPAALRNAITMITFTNEAADNMKKRLKQCFQNYYMLTKNYDFLCLLEQVDKMQISTIHSYAKSIIKQLGSALGYGKDLTIVSGSYDRVEVLEKELEKYLEEKSRVDRAYIGRLSMPVYKLKEILVELITKLYNKSINVARLDSFDFGTVSKDNEELHELIKTVLLRTEQKYREELQKRNLIHLNELMVQLGILVNTGDERLAQIKTDYLFVDEFQDTDDVQIATFLAMQRQMGFKFFVVGDIKQCIYRFRGAEIKAFDRLGINAGQDEWLEFALNKNYRTDQALLKEYEKVFKRLGAGSNPLLPYKQEEDVLFSDILLNRGRPSQEYCRQVIYQSEKNRNDFTNLYICLFDEIKRCREEVLKLKEKGVNLSEAERTIAILVRENWQAEEIRQQGPNYDIPNIKTYSGGDLYQLLPARELYKLVQALLFNDSPRYLLNFICTNYIKIPLDMWFLRKADGKEQYSYLVNLLNEYFLQLSNGKYTWDKLVSDLRYEPVLKVIKYTIDICKPWCNFSDEADSQRYYKINTELLLEKIIQAFSIDYLTLNSLEKYLYIKIITKQKEESRGIKTEAEEVPIVCTTVHKAKGLEYGYVLLPFTNFKIDQIKKTGVDVYVNEGRIGYSFYLDENSSFVRNSHYNERQEALERSCEETRILYVAMTRAIRSFIWFAPSEDVYTPSWAELLAGGMKQ